MLFTMQQGPFFSGSAQWAVRGYLAWCFGLSFQELTLHVAGLRRQSFSLVICVRRSGSYFGPDDSKRAEIDS